jgi:hypothetical protein
VGFLKRLGLGFLKGLVVGLAVGAAFQLGLGWAETGGLLGYLLAMGTGATAGILAGAPPWRAEAWIESVLKGVFGVGVGALLYWVASSFLGFGVPVALAGADAGTPWPTVPLVFAPLVAGVYGAIVELDNTAGKGDGDTEPKKPAGRRRPSVEVDLDSL